MHETRALWLLVPSVTIHLYNDQYTVRLSELTETTVSTVMGTMNLEGSMRYALATAELDEADHQGLLHELLISAHLSASQRISAHLSASQRISAHLSASQRIAAASRSRRHQDRGGIN
jgi:hypothetical protein